MLLPGPSARHNVFESEITRTESYKWLIVFGSDIIVVALFRTRLHTVHSNEHSARWQLVHVDHVGLRAAERSNANGVAFKFEHSN